MASALEHDQQQDREQRDQEQVRTRDLMSVGTRVSWGAVLAGAVITVAVFSALGMLALAIGVTTIDDMRSDVFAVSTAIVMTLALLVSLFVGGFVVSRTTVGEDKAESIMYGLLLWGVVFVWLLLSGSGMGFGLGAMSARSESAQPSATSTPQLAKALGLTEEQIDRYEQMMTSSQVGANPALSAWIGFAAVILSLAAAIAGAVLGAGPKLVIAQLRSRRIIMAGTFK